MTPAHSSVLHEPAPMNFNLRIYLMVPFNPAGKNPPLPVPPA
jgi:hypothetical protein